MGCWLWVVGRWFVRIVGQSVVSTYLNILFCACIINNILAFLHIIDFILLPLHRFNEQTTMILQ